MDTDALLDSAINYITSIFSQNTDGHDTEHSLRVYHYAAKLAAHYPEADKTVIYLSALLHDVDDHKLFNTTNNANARFFLNSKNIDSDTIEKICSVINSVSFSNNKRMKPATIEGCIVQDSDRLDAIGAIGIARTFAYGGKNNRSIAESKDHFYEKLLQLKDLMNTPEAKKLALKKHAYMEEYVHALEKDLSFSQYSDNSGY